MSNNGFIITSTGISLFFGESGANHTVNATHDRFDEIKKLAALDRFDDILSIIDIKVAINSFVYSSENGRIKIDDGVFYFDDKAIHSTLTDRMIDMAHEGLSISIFEKFMENLMENPSYRAVTELYSFLEVGNLPITPDGHFLAYKKIAEDYTDCYTGTMDNSIGKTVEMARHEVDEDKDRTCSYGLHFCSYNYLNCYGGSRVVVVKINPRDVVAIPADYNDTKGRTCRYEVIRELEDYTEERIASGVSVDGREFREDDDYFVFTVSSFDDEECEACGELGGDCHCEPCYICGCPDNEYCGCDDEEEKLMIKATDLRNGVVYWYDNTAEASDELEVKEEYIKRVLKGQKNSTFGYKFEEEMYNP